jgi:hypothetical protein
VANAKMIGAALAVLLAHAGGVRAQERKWGLGIELGLTRFWGASRSVTDDDNPGLKPYRPTSVTARIDREVGHVRLALATLYAKSGVAIDGSKAAVVAKGQLSWIQVGPEISFHLTRLGAAAIRLFGGPTVDVWNPVESDSRTKIGGQAGAELQTPFGSSVAGVVRIRTSLTGSLFKQGELPEGYEVRSMPTAGISLGLRVGV